MLLAWLIAFLVSAAVVGAAGWLLVAATDVIAERTGLARAFLGMILVATITSLPELSTGVSAVAAAGSPDLAVGAIVGSCVFNVLLFAFADVVARKGAFYARLDSSHSLTAAFSILQLGVLAVALAAPEAARFRIGHVGAYSVLLGGLYLASARLLFAAGVSTAPDIEAGTPRAALRLGSAIFRCAASAVAVIVGGAVLAISADRIATLSGLSSSFIGVLLVAAVTSLPELVAVWAAVRLRAFDLAAGNILGSNLFNMVLLVVYDTLYFDGPLLASASDRLALSATAAMMMTAVFIAAQAYARRREPRAVDVWAGVSLVALYFGNAWLIFD